MLQRIQTIWILLAVLGALFLNLTAQDFDILGGNLIINISTVLLILLGLLSIFSFKNRKRQILLNNISIFINALLLGFLIYWLQNLPGGISFPEKGIEPVFSVIAIICLLLNGEQFLNFPIFLSLMFIPRKQFGSLTISHRPDIRRLTRPLWRG